MYGYDNANRVTTEVNAEGTVTYAYDSGGELLSANGSRTESYSYDSGGNRNSTGYTAGTGNELTASPGYTYTYDGEGNMIGETQTSTGDVWTFGYDNRNRLVSAVEKSSGGTTLSQATYTYNALNQRIGFDDNGTQTWTVFDGTSRSQPLRRFQRLGDVAHPLRLRPGRRRDPGAHVGFGHDRLVPNRSPGLGARHREHLRGGHRPRRLRQLRQHLSETSPTNGDRFKFTGMEWDAAIGQYYDHARYYDAAAGRFTSQDTVLVCGGRHEPGWIRYNEPSSMTDPSGLLALQVPTDPPPEVSPVGYGAGPIQGVLEEPEGPAAAEPRAGGELVEGPLPVRQAGAYRPHGFAGNAKAGRPGRH